MRVIHIKTITILIAGVALTAGLIMGFGGYVFAGDPVEGLDITIGSGDRVSDKIYDSSFSKTKSIGLVRKEVGDVLLRYGVGGADINKVTEALEGKGVYEAELKWFLLAIGINEKDAQDILLEFDKIGISKDGARGADAPEKEFTTGDTSSAAGQPGAGQIEKDASRGTGEQRFKDIQGLDSETRSGGFIKLGDLSGERAAFGDSAQKSIQDLKTAESKEQREDIRKELQANRQTLQESAKTLRQNLRKNAQDLRDNFRTEYLKYELKDVRVVSFRIAVAHGKGLRMINRYRSAIARFDHILGRLESRVQKLDARGVDISSTIPLIEEAKNMQVENEAKLAQLEAKYESLLLGENPGGIAKEAHAIAKELKAATENLHAKLRKIGDDIKLAVYDWYPSKNSSKRIALIQSTIEKIQKRLESCDNTDVCDIVDRHAKGRTEITVTIKKAIENGNWEDATRLLREMRGIVVGDIELLEGVENTESIAGVLELERSLLNYIDSALVSI